MMQPAVLRWDRVIHKSARTQDGQAAGYIVADDEESIILLASGFREYSIPKSHVRDFDGSHVTLDFSFQELDQYRIA